MTLGVELPAFHYPFTKNQKLHTNSKVTHCRTITETKL